MSEFAAASQLPPGRSNVCLSLDAFDEVHLSLNDHPCCFQSFIERTKRFKNNNVLTNTYLNTFLHKHIIVNNNIINQMDIPRFFI